MKAGNGDAFHVEHDGDQATLARLGLCLAMIAHEVRNHLAPVRMQCEMALRSADDFDRSRAALEAAATRTAAAAECMEAILAAASANGPDAKAPGGTELHGVIQIAIERVGQPARARCHITVPRGTTTSLPSTVVDAAVANLIKNAFQARPDATIVIGLIRAGSRDVLVIRDDGPGLPASIAHQPFRAFHQSSGTGLGLAIAALLLRANGGDIQLATSGAAGTTWHVVLPMADSAEHWKAA